MARWPAVLLVLALAAVGHAAGQAVVETPSELLLASAPALETLGGTRRGLKQDEAAEYSAPAMEGGGRKLKQATLAALATPIFGAPVAERLLGRRLQQGGMTTMEPTSTSTLAAPLLLAPVAETLLTTRTTTPTTGRRLQQAGTGPTTTTTTSETMPVVVREPAALLFAPAVETRLVGRKLKQDENVPYLPPGPETVANSGGLGRKLKQTAEPESAATPSMASRVFGPPVAESIVGRRRHLMQGETLPAEQGTVSRLVSAPVAETLMPLPTTGRRLQQAGMTAMEPTSTVVAPLLLAPVAETLLTTRTTTPTTGRRLQQGENLVAPLGPLAPLPELPTTGRKLKQVVAPVRVLTVPVAEVLLPATSTSTTPRG